MSSLLRTNFTMN